MTGRPRGTRLLNRSLMHTAAKLHYIDRVSQVEVSRRMKVSTATVSRLLARARDEGIVRIHVADLDETDKIGDTLCDLLDLRAVRVMESGQIAALSSQVRALLTEAELPPGSVIAIGWGRTVQSVIDAGLPPAPGVIVVPTTGGMDQTASHFQSNEFVRAAAEQMRGEACFLHAPLQPSPELRAVLARDPGASRVLEYWSRVDAAIVGIGNFHPEDDPADSRFGQDDVDRVAGDVARRYFDAMGHEVDWSGRADLMAIEPDQLRRIPLCIGVATGVDKCRAILGAARSRMINALVTETRVALRILELLESERLGTAPDGPSDHE